MSGEKCNEQPGGAGAVRPARDATLLISSRKGCPAADSATQAANM